MVVLQKFAGIACEFFRGLVLVLGLKLVQEGQGEA